MAVYGDLFFLINFSMDFLCFYLSCLILHRSFPYGRALLSSVIGGVYSVLALFISVNSVISFTIDAIVLVLMCIIVYMNRKTTLWQMAKCVGVYFLASALLGGVMTALFSLFNGIDEFAEGFGIQDGIEVWIFALLALVSSGITLGGGRALRSSSVQKEAVVRIKSDRGESRFKALVDSGNLAREPISGRAVIFAELDACRGALDDDVYFYLKSANDIADMPASLASKIRFIPSVSVGGSALLPAMRFKRTFIICGKMQKETDAYIAFITDGSLGERQGIISNELII